MATIHWVLQGKGGVGKSLVSSLLTQYLLASGICVHGYDTDPVNESYSRYKAFNVTPLRIMDANNDIDVRLFDPLLESLFALPADAHAVIDNGASSFIPLCSYLRENDALSLLKDQGHSNYLHTVITGGQALRDTVIGLKALCTNFEDMPLVVWLNSFFGSIEDNGKTFEQFPEYAEFSKQFHALINIPMRKHATYGKDLESLFSQHKTFSEGANDPGLPIMVRQRLTTFWRDVAAEISNAHLM